jgi:3-oxoadipate enol-lactonase
MRNYCQVHLNQAAMPTEQEGVLMSFLTVDADQLYYEVVGDGPLVVFIHDGLLHSAAWEAQVAPFATHYRVARYDRRGYGRSSIPTEPYSIRDDLCSLLDHLSASSVTLIGASIGGGIALDFALSYPKQVNRLVLVGAALPGFGFSEHFMQRNRAAMRPLVEEQNIAATITNWANDPYLVALQNAAARDQLHRLLTANPQNLTNPFHLIQRLPAIRPEQLATLQLPTLIVVGEADIPDVHAHAGAIGFTLPNAQRMVLRDAGHLAYLDNAVTFNEAVLAFLAQDR